MENKTKILVEERRELIEKMIYNFNEFAREMLLKLNKETGLEFSWNLSQDSGLSEMVFQANDNDGERVFLILDTQDYSLVEIDDHTEEESYIDRLWEIVKELGL